MSLDGYIAGPDAGREHPLGIGGMDLHEWAFQTASWLEQHGREGGEHGVDDVVVAAGIANVSSSAEARGSSTLWRQPHSSSRKPFRRKT
jgi:hypothetical protein